MGASKSMEGTMSFQIGWPHWWLVAVSGILVFVGVIKSRKTKNFKKFLLPIFFIIVFGLSVFMIHNKSTFIWEKIKILSYVQFPWRFLSVSIFSASLLGGYSISVLKGKYTNILIVGIIALTVVLNWSYFRPSAFDLNVTDTMKLSGESWLDQQKGSITDFLPVTASVPVEPAPGGPIVISGIAKISDFVNKSNEFSFSADVAKESKIDIPVFDFPNWEVKANGKPYGHSLGSIGRIEINLPSGNYNVQGTFKNTPLRTVSNSVSVLSFVLFIGYLIYAKNRKIFK
jgi:uncharacterized membrane protein